MIAFRWHFDEEARYLDEPWRGLWDDAIPRTRIRRILDRMVRLLLFGLLLLAPLASLEDTLRAEPVRAREAMAGLLHQEAQAWLARDWDAARDLLDPEAHPDWATWYLRSLEARRNWAGEDARLPALEVVAAEPLGLQVVLATVAAVRGEVPADQVTREGVVLRRVGGHWRRTGPGNARWGPLHLARVGPLRWEYREADRDAVERVAAELPPAYARVRAALGLPPAPETPGLTVHVVVDPALVRPPVFVGRRIHVLSPRLARTPAGDDPAQALSRPVMAALVDRATEEALPPGGFDPRWGVLYRGLQHWMARRYNPLLGPTDPPDWGPLRVVVAERGLPDLGQLHERRYGSYFWRAAWVDLAAEVLVDVGLGRAGEERLPDLLAAMAETTDWDVFSRRAFGIPGWALEIAWQERMAEILASRATHNPGISKIPGLCCVATRRPRR